MENLKFEGIGQQLSREQMKQINGGVTVCIITHPNGSTEMSVCNGAGEWCQGYMDADCETNSNCSDADCGYK